MHTREKIISAYVDGYNSFDVSKMTTHFSEAVVFENIQNNEVTMTLTGLEAFKAQAEAAKTYFAKRQQTITAFKHEAGKSEIEVDYYGVLAVDLPNGMKKGQEIRLRGRSIFEFKDDKIIRLTDIS